MIKVSQPSFIYPDILYPFADFFSLSSSLQAETRRERYKIIDTVHWFSFSDLEINQLSVVKEMEPQNDCKFLPDGGPVRRWNCLLHAVTNASCSADLQQRTGIRKPVFVLFLPLRSTQMLYLDLTPIIFPGNPYSLTISYIDDLWTEWKAFSKLMKFHVIDFLHSTHCWMILFNTKISSQLDLPLPSLAQRFPTWGARPPGGSLKLLGWEGMGWSEFNRRSLGPCPIYSIAL